MKWELLVIWVELALEQEILKTETIKGHIRLLDYSSLVNEFKNEAIFWSKLVSNQMTLVIVPLSFHNTKAMSPIELSTLLQFINIHFNKIVYKIKEI